MTESALRRCLSMLQVLIFAASVPLSGVLIGQTSASASQVVACQQVFAPAYYWYDLNFFPQWDALISADIPEMTLVVGFPVSRGGPDPAYAWVTQQARENDIRVLAYVQTFFGQRDPGEMADVIESLQGWYALDGIFIDEVMPDEAHIDYYASVVAAARRRPGQLVVINPGGNASRAYVEMADMIVTFEGNVDQYRTFEVPDWMYRYPAEQFIHLVHTAPGSAVDEVISLSKERNAGSIYITDDRPENAYHLLPTYWREFAAAVSSAC